MLIGGAKCLHLLLFTSCDLTGSCFSPGRYMQQPQHGHPQQQQGMVAQHNGVPQMAPGGSFIREKAHVQDRACVTPSRFINTKCVLSAKFRKKTVMKDRRINFPTKFNGKIKAP